MRHKAHIGAAALLPLLQAELAKDLGALSRVARCGHHVAPGAEELCKQSAAQCEVAPRSHAEIVARQA